MSLVEHLSDDVTLYLGDCLDILPGLSADHVISDPPYADNTHKMAKSNKGGHGKKFITFAALDDDQFRDVASACLRASDGWVVMTCDYRHAALMYGDEHFVRLGAWVKPNPMPQISADRPGQGFETVLILHSGGKPKVWNRGGGAGVWTYPVMNGAEVPTQKPLALAAAFVSDFTAPGETILDPFCGSGTTGVAAVKAGRGFIGIEADPAHFEISRRRISDELRRPRLQLEPVAKPVQEAMQL